MLFSNTDATEKNKNTKERFFSNNQPRLALDLLLHKLVHIVIKSIASKRLIVSLDP
jgi:hypothetical protein